MVDAALFVDRRESTLNEAGDFLFPLREGAIGPEHIRAEIGELLIGAAEGRRSPDELTVFKSLGLAVEDLAAAEHVLQRAEAENVGAVVVAVIPLDEIDRAREVLARHRGADAARAARRRLRRRDLAQARAAAAGATRSRSAAPATRSCRRPTQELAGGVLTASAGNMAQGVAYAARLRGVPATIVVPEHAPQTKIDAIERLGGTRDQACPTTSGGRCSSTAATRASTGSSSTRSTTSA